MISESNIVFHIGLLKTASTTLQNQFFPQCLDVNFLHRHTMPAMGKFINLVVNKNPAYFDKNESLKLFDGFIKKDKVNVVSAENLSGQLFATVGLPSLDFRQQILQNLSSTFPEAKVVIVIRRQDGLAKSMYREYLRQGGTKPVKRYFGLSENKRPPVLSNDCFLFKPYIYALNKLFPRGVKVLAFEELVSDQATFLEKLTKFSGISDKNFVLQKTNSTRMGSLGLEVTRYLNFVFKSQLNPTGILPGIPLKINGSYSLRSPVKSIHNIWPGKGSLNKSSNLYQASEEVFEMCKKDNEALDKAYALDLKKYGYW